MIYLFMLLTFSYSVLIILIYLTKEYRKPSLLIFLTLFTIFYTPSLYYLLGGTTYLYFSNETLFVFMKYAIGIVFITIGSLIIQNMYILPYIKSFSKNNHFVMYKKKFLINLYFTVIIAFPLMYLIYFYHKLPLLNFLLSGEMIERIDVSGSIPFFFTYISVVDYLLPAIYFYFFNRIKSIIVHFIINFGLVFFLIAAGHKGFVTYYMIFIWFYVMKFKVNIKLIFAVILLFVIFAITKGYTDFNQETFEYIMNSPFRRFFVTQGTCFIYRIEFYLHQFPIYSGDTLKQSVYTVMYNGVLHHGGAPTFFIGDLIYYFGIFWSYVAYFFFINIILLISNYIYYLQSNDKLILYWMVYGILYILSMAEFSFENFLRITMIISNVLIIIFLIKLKGVKHVKKNN
jgi:hypothetical protein